MNPISYSKKFWLKCVKCLNNHTIMSSSGDNGM